MPLLERLELIDDPEPRSATMNMAVDEALLNALAKSSVLRIYRWRGRAVSFGYFESHDAVRRRYPAEERVRRWTGGGTVEHGPDLTYSLLVPRSLPFAVQPAAETYRQIHAALARALACAGWREASLQIVESAPATGANSAACFVHPVRHDVLLGNRKIAGAAQRRTRHGLLHQGSVQGLELTARLRTAFVCELARELAAQVLPRGMTVEELAEARKLDLEKYGTCAWMNRF